MKTKYLNDQIKASEVKRLKGLDEYRPNVSPEVFEQFETYTLKKFIGWYIQRSLNAQWQMGFNLVREEIRHRDEMSGVLSMDTAQVSEVGDSNEPLYQDGEDDDQFKAAQALIRGSRYQSQFAEM